MTCLIRKTRPYVPIKFVKEHDCSDACFLECKHKYTGDKFNVNLCLKTYLDLDRYFLNCHLDIPLAVTLIISFPLINPATRNITTETGFTVLKILEEYRQFYLDVYEEEMRSSTQEVVYECKECISFTSDVFKFCSAHEETCNICLDSKDDVFIQLLTCNHKMHEQCARKWFMKRNQCAFCRRVVKPCLCDGTRQIVDTVPVEGNSSYPYREQSNGIHGIGMLHFESLLFNKLVYDTRAATFTIQGVFTIQGIFTLVH